MRLPGRTEPATLHAGAGADAGGGTVAGASADAEPGAGTGAPCSPFPSGDDAGDDPIERVATLRE